MVTVNSFFCFRLHTAGVLLGWIGSALSLLNIITYTILLSRVDDLAGNITAKATDIPNDHNKEHVKTGLMIIFSIYLTINVIDCVASIMLIAGTIKEKYLLIVPWLINSGISLLFNFINVITAIVFFVMNGTSVAPILVVLVVAVLLLGIQFMAWLAMYSLFKLLKASSEHQRLNPGKSGIPSYTRI